MTSGRSSSGRALATILTLIVTANAVLLFSVEPMFSKMVLPLLGGTPSVWNTCLVFFQAALLVGYGYAHALTRIRSPKHRAVVHVVVLALSCIVLPLSIAHVGEPPTGNAGILWLLALLTMSLGPPFVVLASGAPLAQRWLADTGHPDAANPYFLYAASNLGSLVALMSYPILVEPSLTLSAQRAVWSIGYVILIALIAICFSTIAWRHVGGVTAIHDDNAPPISRRRKAVWVLYAAVPASLLVASTTYISTDVAAVPLLWVLPLCLYLLSFVIVFSRRPVVPHSWMLRAAPHALVIVTIPVFWNMRLPGLPGVAAHLIVLFIVSMVCHGELAHRRPPTSQLTEFFVWVAAGGLIGGAFTAIAAPVVFNRIYEYPITLALAGMLLKRSQADDHFGIVDVVLPVGLGTVLLLTAIHIDPLPGVLAILASVVFGTALFSFRGRPIRFGLGLATVFAAGYVSDALRPGVTRVLDSERSYFGAYRVARNSGSHTVTFYHGTTLHGAQSFDSAIRLVPLTYYHPNGPSADVFTETSSGMKANRKVGVVGLGAGSLACYGRSGERWTYYEIDPVVARIALHHFTFLRDCPPAIHIVIGDARLTLAAATDTQYDILVVDAFSSDAIPVHLLTLEAFSGYASNLAPGGVIAVHISNDHLELEPVIGALAAQSGLTARVRRDLQIPESEAHQERTPAIWMILARSRSDLGQIENDARWVQPRMRDDLRVWTDDYSNIIRVFKWRE